MERPKPRLLERKELKDWIGRPVWYQVRSRVNDFGWAFIHPDTVKLQSGGYLLGYCRLIVQDPCEKDSFRWDDISLYDRPAFRGLCYYCEKRYEGQVIHCQAAEKSIPCTWENKYREFKCRPPYDGYGYTAKTFIRQMQLAGWKTERNQKSEIRNEGNHG